MGENPLYFPQGSTVQLLLLTWVKFSCSWRHENGRGSPTVCHMIAWAREIYSPFLLPLTNCHIQQEGKVGPSVRRVEELILHLISEHVWGICSHPSSAIWWNGIGRDELTPCHLCWWETGPEIMRVGELALTPTGSSIRKSRPNI